MKLRIFNKQKCQSVESSQTENTKIIIIKKKMNDRNEYKKWK